MTYADHPMALQLRAMNSPGPDASRMARAAILASRARPDPAECVQFCTDSCRLRWKNSRQSRRAERAVTSIIPFIGNAVFEPADIKMMSDAYDNAIEDVYAFGRPNKVVRGIVAGRIISLAKGGERNPDRLREGAFAACGFNPAGVR
jgi:hypothetical protein